MIHRGMIRLMVYSVAILTATRLWSQEPKSPASTGTYRLDYVFSELQDNKRVNTRTYTVLLRVKDKAVIKLGNRIPIATGISKEGSTEVQYLDIGQNIDCVVREELDSSIDLMTTSDTSSLVPEQGSNHTGDPVIRQVRYDLENIVPLGKPTLLGAAEEIDGTRHFQIEVTATKVR